MNALQPLLVVALLASPSVAQVHHVRPSAVARRVASQLPWKTSLPAALAAAKEMGQNVFWYVPTVPRSPMDRKPIIDLYMRAGFFSDPDLTALLAHFVLVDAIPTRKQARRYGLVPFRFIEPGFVILDASGKELHNAHAISTFHPCWFAAQLEPYLPASAFSITEGDTAAALRLARLFPHRFEKPDVPKGAESAKVRIQLALDALSAARPKLALERLAGLDEQRAAFLRGAANWVLGQHTRARQVWRELADAASDSPWGWRAAAEAEGFGPIARGFFRFRALPEPADEGWLRGLTGTTYPRTKADIPMLCRRSFEFLLGMQGEHGGFEDSNYDFGGLDSVPNVNVAVTAICVRALFRYRSLDPVAADRAIARGLGYVLDPKRVNPQDKDEWIWARIYPIHLIADLLAAGWNEKGYTSQRLQSALASLVKSTFERQDGDGSFRHEYANPFTTAAVLIAFKAAEQQGVQLDDVPISRALASLLACRSENGAFSYSQMRVGGKPRGSQVGAAGRMPLCESALLLFGRSDKRRLAQAFDVAFRYRAELEKTRKYDDHAGAYRYGGFFFWYDMLGRRVGLELLGEAGKAFRRRQLAIILQVPEIDGCFVDSHELGRSYGTAMALLCLE